MPIDFSAIPQSIPAKRPIEPLELFRSLQVTDPLINDLWLAQGDALREWDKNRNREDIAIVLNTGAGKTLVGLLIAQSLVNETNEGIIYACSSIQLIEQTASKAKGYGLDVTTYYEGNFSNTLYHRGLTPCLTTYQALFNGKSRFFREPVNSVVFDDAHSAEHLLRDAFTLKINKSKFSRTFSQITSLFRNYITQIGEGVEYAETLEAGSTNKSWFIPPFVIHANIGGLQESLLEAKLTEQQDTMFSWGHLRNKIELCSVFVGGQDIYFTPPVIPTLALPYFQKGRRRIYLSATLTAKDAFVRAFGKIPDPLIAPQTTAGECERLILIPRETPNCSDIEIDVTKKATEPHKTLILVPSERDARKWADYIGEQSNDNVTAQVEAFKNSLPPTKLLLKGRYDGVDLPGDTCRVMIIDQLPSGVGPLEKFLWERLGLHRLLRSTIASRIVQSFGRISRGMSDHGVVFITGENLHRWLAIAANKASLPKFLAQQLELGFLISERVTECDDLITTVTQCLKRDANWVRFYKERMGESNSIPDPEQDEEALQLALTEAEYGLVIWERDYVEAAQILSQNLDKTFTISGNAGAWHSLWLGYCYQLIGDTDAALEMYNNARKASKNIPPPIDELAIDLSEISFQVREISRYLIKGGRVVKTGFRNFDRDLSALDGTGTVAQTEEAIRKLGEYLGFESTRPDNESGAGPDVLWTFPNGPAFCQELKTDKELTSKFSKKEVGQMHNHIQWCVENLTTETVLPTFIGYLSPADSLSSPTPEMIVIELAEYKKIADRLRAALEDISNSATPVTINQRISDIFQERDLLWSELYESMNKYKLIEIS